MQYSPEMSQGHPGAWMDLTNLIRPSSARTKLRVLLAELTDKTPLSSSLARSTIPPWCLPEGKLRILHFTEIPLGRSLLVGAIQKAKYGIKCFLFGRLVEGNGGIRPREKQRISELPDRRFVPVR